MADEQQLNLLNQGVHEWNSWRAQRPDIKVKLSGGALRGLDLTGAQLSRADLTGADMRGTVLSSADLTGALLRDANLFKAVLHDVDLEGADLRGAKFLHFGQLTSAQNWERTYRDEELACGADILAS